MNQNRPNSGLQSSLIKSEPLEEIVSSCSMTTSTSACSTSNSVVKQEAVSTCDDSMSSMIKLDIPMGSKSEKREELEDSITTTSDHNQLSISDFSDLKPKEENDSKASSSSASTPPSSIASSVKSLPSAPPKKKIFKPDELRQALMPTLEKLYRQDPESLPFRQPVDPQLLQIPDYFEIIKKPMDLSTIKRKLDTGQYIDPWQYVEDVWLMFDNAWLYNKKTSRVYRYCNKVNSSPSCLEYQVLIFFFFFSFFLSLCYQIYSWLKFLNKKLIQLCKV